MGGGERHYGKIKVTINVMRSSSSTARWELRSLVRSSDFFFLIYLLGTSGLCHGTWTLERMLSSCGTWVNCLEACESKFPGQGSNLNPLCGKADS